MLKYKLSLAIIALGVFWLLNVLQIMPSVQWLKTGGLALAGVLVLLIGGKTRLALVIGPLLIFASAITLFSQLELMPPRTEAPVLLIAFGVFMFISQFITNRPPRDIQRVA